jgi:uncharacterized protein YcbX
VIAFNGDEPFQEFQWLGKTLTIGETELRVDQKCERCTMINVDPAGDSSVVDPAFLRTVGKQLDACFGVYAHVVQTGTVQVNDPIYLFS